MQNADNEAGQESLRGGKADGVRSGTGVRYVGRPMVDPAGGSAIEGTYVVTITRAVEGTSSIEGTCSVAGT